MRELLIKIKDSESNLMCLQEPKTKAKQIDKNFLALQKDYTEVNQNNKQIKKENRTVLISASQTQR